MQTYIGIKMIQASPADKNGVDGYIVIYPDDYVSWSPKEQFESAYFPLEVPNSITPADLEKMTAQVTVSQADPKTTLVNTKLLTGFELYATSSCVDPSNYSKELGKKYGTDDINKKLWFALGFVLQWAKYGLKKIEKI